MSPLVEALGTVAAGRRRRLGDAAVLAAGIAGALVLARWSPLPSADPLRGVLTALPLVGAFLALAGARSRGSGFELERRAVSLELLLLSIWIAGALARPALGVPASERALAVAFFLLLAGHLARRLVALGRELGEISTANAPTATSPPSVAARLFFCALALYTALLPWSTSQRPPDGDEPWYLLTAHSIAQDLDTDLADDYRDEESRRFLGIALEPQPGDPRGPAGEVYSRHDPLLPLLLSPFFWVAGKHGALFAISLLAALTVTTWWRLAEFVWPSRPLARLAQWCVIALCPPFLLYSAQIWVEVPAALLVTLGLLAVARLRREPSASAWTLLALCVLGLPALKLRFAALAASLLGIAFLALPRQRRRLSSIAAAGALVGAAFLWHNQRLFGNALRIHEWQELLLYRHPWSSYLAHFLGLFFDVAFGLFAAAPIWMLLLPGVARTLRATEEAEGREARDLLIAGAILCAPYLVLVASRREWFGGWSPPFRYPLALLPVLALFTIPAWSDLRLPRARLLASVVGLATLGLLVVVVAQPGLAYNFADGRSRLLDVWSGRLGLDLAPWVPSSVRLRAATWWAPLVATLAVLAVWPLRSPPTGDRVRLPVLHRPRVAAALLGGASILLCAGVALPVLAATKATRRVDVESPHVRKDGGHPDPDPWMFDRRRFPEAWVLPEGRSAEADVRAASDLVELRVAGRAIVNHPGALVLQISCGDLLLARIRFDQHDVWQERAAGPLPWEPGCALVARVPPDGARPPGVVNGVAIDRIELHWR